MLTCLFRKTRLRRGQPPIPSSWLRTPLAGLSPGFDAAFQHVSSAYPHASPAPVSSERLYDSVFDAFEHRALVGRCHFLSRRHYDILPSLGHRHIRLEPNLAFESCEM